MKHDTNSCPACSSKSFKKHEVSGVRICRSCEAVYTTHAIYLGESYQIVLPYWHKGSEEPELVRYFDLDTIGSQGFERRHGWFHTVTKKITQTG